MTTNVSRHAPKARYYYGWNIVALCVLSQSAALGVPFNCLSLFLPGWVEEFNVSPTVFAMSVTVFSVGCALLAGAVGYLADKMPARRIMGWGLIGIAAAHAAIGFATESWHIVALYCVAFPIFVTASAGIPAQTLVSRWFVRRRGLALGLSAFGIALAGVVFPPIITSLIPSIGWRGVWWVFAAVIGILVVPAIFLLIRDRPGVEESKVHALQTAENVATSITLKEILSRRNLWVLVAAFLPVQFVSSMISVIFAPVILSHGHSLQTAGVLLAVFSVAALCGKLGSGLLADRIGNRIPLVAVALLAGAGACLLAVAHDLTALTVATICIGLSQGHWTLLASCTAYEYGPNAFGRAYGWINTFAPLGSFAPPIATLLNELQGSYAPALIGFGVLAFAAAFAALFFRETRGPTQGALAGQA